MSESSNIQRVALAWKQRARALASWTMAHVVNRSDVWGGYLPVKYRMVRTRVDGTKSTIKSVTKPRIEDRGKVTLDEAELVKHFHGVDHGDIRGLHTTSPENKCRWFLVEVDLHDGDQSADPQVNFNAMVHWHDKLVSLGFNPLLSESNGKGGYHLRQTFAKPIPSQVAYAFSRWLTEDFKEVGLARAPECFPKQPALQPDDKGNWCRLYGRHHTGDHWTRVWDSSPSEWLDGNKTIDHILANTGDTADLIPGEARSFAEAEPPRPPTLRPERTYSGGSQESARDVALRCLDALSPSRADDYETWLKVGMALHSVDSSVAMLDEWDRWSRQSPKYAEGDCADKWRGFRNGKGRSVSLGSLVQWAKENGLTNVRQPGAKQKPARKAVTSDSSSSAQPDSDQNEAPPAVDPATIYTEYSNAQKLAKRFGAHFRWSPQWGQFLTWQKTRFQPDLHGQCERFAKLIAREQ